MVTMTTRPPPSPVVALVLILLLLDVSVGCGPGGPPSYTSFCYYRNGQYYSGVADACGQLIAGRGAQATNEIRLAGEDARLPELLREMHSTYVNVNKSNVTIVFDIYASYAVVWHEDEYKTNVWELIVRSEAEPKYVLVRTNK
jgi:hypothetical protein